MIRLIRKSEIEQLFPNQRQQEIFLNILSHVIAIDPIDKAIVVNVNDKKPVIIKEKDAAAGFKAGEHARFDRPVEAGGTVRRLK